MRKIAEIYSVLFHPLTMPTYAMLLLPLGWNVSTQGMLLWCKSVVMLTFLLTCWIPLSILLLLLKTGVLTDIYMRDRKSRTIPYICSLVAALSWCWCLYHVFEMPAAVLCCALSATAVLLCLMLINYWWKISAHLAFIGALLGSIIGYCRYLSIMPWWLWGVCLFLALLMMYARIFLNEHTPAQTMSGFLLGITLTFFPITFLF